MERSAPSEHADAEQESDTMMVREMKVSYRKRGETEGRMDGPAVIAEAVRMIVGDDPREHVCVLYLDARLHRINVEVVGIGIINQALVHPREVFRTAIWLSACSIVVAHQHPTGDPEPSPDDITATRRLAKAGHLLGISVKDHVVVGAKTFTSLRETHPQLFVVTEGGDRL